MSKNILIIGPFPPPIYGMSFANQVLFNELQKINIPVNKIDFKPEVKNYDFKPGTLSFAKLKYLTNYFKVYQVLKAKCVYITIGLTFSGVMKYLPFILTAKLFGKKLVFHSHGNYLHITYNNSKGLKKWLFKQTLSLFDGGIVLSEILKENLIHFIPEKKLHIVYNFVEEEQIEYYKRNFHQKKYDSLKIVYMSNLMEEKGIFELLNALKNINNSKRKIKLKLAGNIPSQNKETLMNLINNLDNVEYLGVVSGEEKMNLLLSSTIFCLPTYYPMEGQPISILEAMAAGNLILTTKHAGIPDICDEKGSVFVKKQNADSIVNALTYLSQNIESLKDYGKYNQGLAMKKYRVNRFVEEIKNVCLN